MENWEKTVLKPEQIKNIVCKYFDSLPDDHVVHNVPYIFIHLGNSYEVAKVQAKASYEARQEAERKKKSSKSKPLQKVCSNCGF